MIDHASPKPKNGLLYFSVVVLNLSSFTTGLAFSWSSPSIPQLLATDGSSPLPPLTQAQTSWIISLVALGAVFSPPLAAFGSDRFGRKITLMAWMLPICAGFAMLAFARDVTTYYVARAMCGSTIGGVYTVVPIYIGEICTKDNRGMLSCFLILILSSGSLLMYSLGPYVSIQTMGCVTIIAPVVFFVTVGFFVPESPYYLVARNRYQDARISLAKLRGFTNNSKEENIAIDNELDEITKTVVEAFENKASVLDVFRSKVLFKSLLVMLSLVTVQQFSGVNCIMLYLQTIFQASAGDGDGLSPELGAIIIAITQFVAAIFTSVFVDRLGRRPLLILSAVGSMISLAALGAFFFLQENYGNEYVASIAFLPVTSLVVFMSTYTFGLGPIPFTVMGEIFPPNVKAAVSMITISLCLAQAYLNTMFFGYMVDAIGNAASFWFYAACCAVGAVVFMWTLPETKGKSLMEIQAMLNKVK